MSLEKLNCPGCGRQRTRAAMWNVGSFFGQPHFYLLCAPCTKRMLRSPLPLLDWVELQLVTPRGRA